jgi:hypothetical protein
MIAKIYMTVLFLLTGCATTRTVYTESVPTMPYAVLFKRGGSYQIVSMPADSIIIETKRTRIAIHPESGTYTLTFREE